MTRDEALVVLGVEPQAEAAEVDSAYRRLMRTVHPDICSGPEAGRLARQAAVARGVLREQSQASLSPIGSAQHRSRPQSVWPMSGYPPGVVDDDHLARIVVAVVEVVGGCLSRDEVVGAVVGAVEWGGVAPAVRRAAVERLRHRDFWGFGQRSGLWKLRGRDIVLGTEWLPRGQTPGFRARAPPGPNGSPRRPAGYGGSAWRCCSAPVPSSSFFPPLKPSCGRVRLLRLPVWLRSRDGPAWCSPWIPIWSIWWPCCPMAAPVLLALRRRSSRLVSSNRWRSVASRFRRGCGSVSPTMWS